MVSAYDAEIDKIRLTVGSIRLRHVELAQPEIAQSDMTSIVEQNILGFQVTIRRRVSNLDSLREAQVRNSPVDHVERMQMLQRAQQFCRIESTPRLIKLALPLQVVEQLSSIHERQHQVQLLRRLKGELEGDDEGIVDFGEDRSFGESVGDF